MRDIPMGNFVFVFGRHHCESSYNKQPPENGGLPKKYPVSAAMVYRFVSSSDDTRSSNSSTVSVVGFQISFNL